MLFITKQNFWSKNVNSILSNYKNKGDKKALAIIMGSPECALSAAFVEQLKDHFECVWVKHELSG